MIEFQLMVSVLEWLFFIIMSKYQSVLMYDVNPWFTSYSLNLITSLLETTYSGNKDDLINSIYLEIN